jgi:hypothetical protein
MANSQPPGDAPAGSASPNSHPPRDPKPNDTWVDDAGDLYTYDGKDWVPFEDVPFFEPNTTFRDV